MRDGEKLVQIRSVIRRLRKLGTEKIEFSPEVMGPKGTIGFPVFKWWLFDPKCCAGVHVIFNFRDRS